MFLQNHPDNNLLMLRPEDAPDRTVLLDSNWNVEFYPDDDEPTVDDDEPVSDEDESIGEEDEPPFATDLNGQDMTGLSFFRRRLSVGFLRQPFSSPPRKTSLTFFLSIFFW